MRATKSLPPRCVAAPERPASAEVACWGSHAERFVERHTSAVLVAVFARSLHLEADGDFLCIGDASIGKGPLNATVDAAGWARVARKLPPAWQRGAHRCRKDRDRWRCGEYGSSLDVAAALLATCCRGRTPGGGPGRPCAPRRQASSRRWPCPHRAGIARRAGLGLRSHRATARHANAAMGERTPVGVDARTSACRPARSRPGPHAIRRRPAVRCARRAARHRQGRCEPRSPRGNCRARHLPQHPRFRGHSCRAAAEGHGYEALHTMIIALLENRPFAPATSRCSLALATRRVGTLSQAP